MKLNIEKLKKIGNEWTKGHHHRIYFNGSFAKAIGLERAYYKTGNISSAYLKGNKISNREAGNLTVGKVYFDVNAEEFKFWGVQQYLEQDIVDYYTEMCK